MGRNVNSSHRVDQFLKSLERNCAGLRVLVVCHGNIMEGFRILLERLTQNQWINLRDSGDPKDKIHNCQIFWYSRRNPETRYIHGSIKWTKSICPWKTELSPNKWEPLVRPHFTNEDLSSHVQSIAQLVNNDPTKDESAADAGVDSYQAIPN